MPSQNMVLWFKIHDGQPINDLKWLGDTPYSTAREYIKETCELLWIVNIHTGDYHDNMNSDIFMKWVHKKWILVLGKKSR